MTQGPRFLSAEQALLITLMVQLAVVATLATMLVRYRRFRRITSAPLQSGARASTILRASGSLPDIGERPTA